MKKLKKVVFINSGIFPAHIGLCNSKQSWQRLMRYMKISDPTGFAECGRCDSFESNTGGLTVVISVNPKAFKHCKKRDIYSMLSHEAKHAHDALMDHIRQQDRCGEFSAYTIDWLVREAAKAFKL